MSKLYVVGTPIGNLNDMTPRAVETLKKVNFIAAEDTRVTQKLLTKFKIDTKVVSYREQNHKVASLDIIRSLLSGKEGALVTDAGMPGISDPGFMLVKCAIDNGIEIVSVPGPCAITAALSISGIDCENFMFLGFLPKKPNDRILKLGRFKNFEYPIAIYEAPHRLKRTLNDIYQIYGGRDVFICKELTKIHEGGRLLNLKDALCIYEEIEPRGEYVVVIGANKKGVNHSIEEAVEFGADLLNRGIKISKVAKVCASIYDFNKNEIYLRLAEIEGETQNKKPL